MLSDYYGCILNIDVCFVLTLCLFIGCARVRGDISEINNAFGDRIQLLVRGTLKTKLVWCQHDARTYIVALLALSRPVNARLRTI